MTVASDEQSPVEAQKIYEREGEAVPFSFLSVLVSFLNVSDECESNKD